MFARVCLTAAAFLVTLCQANALELQVWVPAIYSPSSGFAPGGDIHKQLYEKFQKDNPDITLRYEVLDAGPPGLQRILTAGSSKILPDAAIVDGQWVARLIQAKIVQPLDQFWSKQDQDDFHPDVIKAETFDGKPYAIMFQTGMRGLLYRPSTLKSLGLDKLPSTWDELLAASKAFKAKGMTGVLLPAKAVDEPSTMHLLSMFWGLGGVLVDDKGAPVFQTGDNAKALVTVLRFYRDLVSAGAMLPNVTAMDEIAIRPYLYSGEVVSFGQSSSGVKQIWTDFPPSKGDLAVAAYPMPSGRSAVTILGGFSYAMMATDAERQKAAWKFIAFMTRSDNMGAIDDVLGQLPVRASIWRTNEFFSKDPLMRGFKILYDGPMQTRPSVPIYPAISAAISTVLSDVVAGKVTPEDAVVKAGETVMTEYKRQEDR